MSIPSAEDVPTWVGHVEISEPIRVQPVRPEDVDGASRAHVLATFHHQPIGFVDVVSGTDGIEDVALREALWQRLGPQIREHARVDGLAEPDALATGGLGVAMSCASEAVLPESGPPMSVIVCTRFRPEKLQACIDALLRLDYPDYEVVVVDNGPDVDSRAIVEKRGAEDPRLRYAVEPEMGLSRARNTGLHQARHPWLAFTDDDTLVDPLWLRAIARGISRGPDVGAVTGLVPAASLLTESQRYFDRWLSWSGGLQPRVYDLERRPGDNSLYPYNPGVLGTGANFAIERGLAEHLGGFDPALGAGSRAGGGEDLDLFLRVLLSGRAIAYEPAALVWHVHREEPEALARQLYTYGLGYTALLTKHLLDPVSRPQLLRRLPVGVRRMRRAWTDGVNKTGRALAVPAKLDGHDGLDAVTAPERPEPSRPPYRWIELKGMAAGPVSYLRGRRS
ncbi:MAG: hypothetical protein JWM85_850 [Acidimicrobiaceae bacterium]|nr:hypothetical protein [Acidimicrobiaceae bacterium]